MSRLSGEPKPVGDFTFLGEPIPKKLQTLWSVCLSRQVTRRLSSAKAMADASASILQALKEPEPEEDLTPSGRWTIFKRS